MARELVPIAGKPGQVVASREAQKVAAFHRRQQEDFSRAIDDLWEGVRRTVSGLQAEDRLPRDGELYDPRIEGIREFLYQARPNDAEREAKRLAKNKAAAGFVAYQLLMQYHILLGNPRKFTQLGTDASKLLDQAAKQVRKARRR